MPLTSSPAASRKAYPSDLNDPEWEIIEPLLPKPKGFGHPRTTDLREVVNAIFYVIRSGCQWEMLPHDLPHPSTVYSYFSKWKKKGIWQAIHDKLRVEVREKVGKKAQVTAAIADSQTVKTAEKRGRSGALMAGS
jgi:putative transposase